MLFVLPFPDPAGQVLKDLVPSKSSLPWYEMASQYRGVVIGAYGSLLKKKPGNPSVLYQYGPPPLSSEGLPYDEGSLLHLIRPDVPFMRGHLCPCLASPGTATETVGSTSVVGRNTHPVLLIYPQVFKKGVNRHTRSYADVSLYGQIKVDR